MLRSHYEGTSHDPYTNGLNGKEPWRSRLHSLRGDPRKWSTQAGYAGAVAYGNFLLQALKNQSFQRLSKEKTGVSVKKWYLDQPDPLYFAEKGK